MAVSISFLKVAQQDIEQAFTWYEYRQQHLGDAFLKQVDQSLEQIKHAPEAYPIKFKSLRIKLLNAYPYALFYKIERKNAIRIYACLHLRKNITRILKNR